MPTAEEAVVGLLRRLAAAQGIGDDQPGGQAPGRSSRQARLVKRSTRILASAIAATVPDGETTLDSMRGKLSRDPDDGARRLVRFEELYRRLRHMDTLQQPHAMLHLLDELADSKPDHKAFSPVVFEAPVLQLNGMETAASRRTPEPEPEEFSPSEPSTGGGSAPVPEHVRRRNLQILSEPALLRDVLYAFQGINGEVIKYSATLESFVFDASFHISPATKDLASQLCEMGWLYNRISKYLSSRAGAGRSVGAMGQAFCSGLQLELTEYYRLVAVLETQLTDEPPRLGAPSEVGLTLRRLAVWSQDPLERLQLMAMLVESVGDLRGGALASCLAAHLRHGDPLVQSFVSRLLERVCVPLSEMVMKWVTQGELTDPHHEFFVMEEAGEGSRPPVPLASVAGDASSPDQWRKYALREDMIPKFLPLPVANQVLVLGKALNFMRRCCQDTQWVTSSLADRLQATTLASMSPHQTWAPSSVPAAPLSAASAPAVPPPHTPTPEPTSDRFSIADWVAELHGMVKRVGPGTNARLLSLMLDKYKLRTHLSAIKKFLLLGQGDFVVFLMDALKPELDKVADSMVLHSVTGILDGALRSSNAQYETTETLERLTVRLLTANPRDRGWEVFSLDYHVDSPITAVIHPESGRAYREVFHLLWRMKRVEFVLSAAWRQHMMAATVRMSDVLPELAQYIHECNLTRNRMWHFAQNLSSYMMFEVLEESWAVLQTRIDAARDLDELIEAHDSYLLQIKHKALLAPEMEGVSQQLYAVFDTIVQFCEAQDTLFQDALTELHRRRSREQALERHAVDGEWAPDEDEPELAYQEMISSNRTAGVSEQTVEQLRDLNMNYQASFDDLLVRLQESTSGTEVLRFLMFRLDFNGYYNGVLQQATPAPSMAIVPASPGL